MRKGPSSIDQRFIFLVTVPIMVFFLGFLLFIHSNAFGVNDLETGVVDRRDFSRKLLFTGELRAANSIVITVPELRKVKNFTISYLAPEGELVQTGDILVKFDTAELELRQLTLEKELEEARINISRIEADIETESTELELALAVAESSLEIAELYAGIDPELIPRADHEEYVFRVNKDRFDLDKANERLVAFKTSAQAELEIAKIEFEQADLELQRVLTDIERMTQRAPAPGLVVYENSWDLGRKFQIGDSVQRRHPIMRLPDMEKMLVLTIVYTADFPHLNPGMPAKITLDAYPTRVFQGNLNRLPEIARPLTRSAQLPIFLVEFMVLDSGSSLMKTGMTAQIEVELPPEERLTVPRECIQLDEIGRCFVTAVDNLVDRIYVDVIDTNAGYAAVQGDLRIGLQLIRGDLADGNSAREDIDWITLKRQDLVFTVAGTGFARPSKAIDLGPPAVPGYTRFRLIDMVEEGIHVKQGDFLMEFDPSDLERRIRSERSNRARMAQEYERQKAKP